MKRKRFIKLLMSMPDPLSFPEKLYDRNAASKRADDIPGKDEDPFPREEYIDFCRMRDLGLITMKPIHIQDEWNDCQDTRAYAAVVQGAVET